jgi:hypothetical protein
MTVESGTDDDGGGPYFGTGQVARENPPIKSVCPHLDLRRQA